MDKRIDLSGASALIDMARKYGKLKFEHNGVNFELKEDNHTGRFTLTDIDTNEDVFTNEYVVDARNELVKLDGEYEYSAEEILNNPGDYKYKGYEITSDIELVNGKKLYTVWSREHSFIVYRKPYDEAVKLLTNIEDTIKQNEDEDEQYIRENLPKLWGYYKDGAFDDPDSIFSDYYKEVFNHRPRSVAQVEFEIHELANDLGIKLD